MNVATGIGWERGRELAYNSFTKLTPNADYTSAALTQIAIASTVGQDALNASACAWFAVGAVSADILKARSLLCPGSNPPNDPTTAPAPTTSASAAPPPSSNPACRGSSTAYICSDGAPGFAVACDATKPDVYCADPSQVCKRASATDSTATVGSDGALECE